MTRVKSLKYQVEEAGHGYVHRIHRGKKKRRVLKPKEVKSIEMKQYLRSIGKMV